MAMVAISLRVLPTSPEIDLERLKGQIAKVIEIREARTEPVAFGLMALKILIVAPDIGTEEIESKIKALPGVANVMVEKVTLI